jgi:hypothetical protein
LEISSLGKAIPENLEHRCQDEFAKSREIKVEVIIQEESEKGEGGEERGK